jgi:hypothetical protein
VRITIERLEDEIMQLEEDIRRVGNLVSASSLLAAKERRIKKLAKMKSLTRKAN